jgi:NADPH:quinone reductase-like Zn-dependent oxidoreductase
MNAMVSTAYGSPDVLQSKEVAKPAPKDDDVLIKVHAASVNRSDWEMLIGKPLYARFGGLLKPRRHILGSDIAGRVEVVGSNVSAFNQGMTSSETSWNVWVGLPSMSALVREASGLRTQLLTLARPTMLSPAPDPELCRQHHVYQGSTALKEHLPLYRQ